MKLMKSRFLGNGEKLKSGKNNYLLQNFVSYKIFILLGTKEE